MVNDQFKMTVYELNKCLNKSYNLISFDSLSSTQLIQVLCDVLEKVNQDHKINVQEEDLEDVTVRILDILRVLKYKPVSGISGPSFRLGLMQGEKKVIHPILEWLLSNLEDLKKRAYLAQFLVKIEVPPEILADPDVAHLFEQYEATIQDFKVIHKENDSLKRNGTSVTELKSDISAMEGEKEIVCKRIGKLQKQTENAGGKTQLLLEAAKNLRKEKEREKELSGLESRQKSHLLLEDQRLRRLQLRLNELRRSAAGASARALLRRLEEELAVNSYISKQKLPQEIRVRQTEVDILETVQNEPDLTRSTVEELNDKVRQISQEINETIERQLAGQNLGEDKNAPFRQQAAIIGRKKENKAEQLSDLRSRLSSVEEELEEKRIRLKEVAGDTVLRGEEFKKYVNKLRGRSSVYKKNRAELAALKAEAGVLSRTCEVLSSRDRGVLLILAEREEKHKVVGFRETKQGLEQASEAKAELDSIKGKTLEEMSTTILELSRRVASKKSQLAPAIAELRPLRERFRELGDEHEQKRRIYDATASGLENSTAKLHKEVEKLKSEVEETEGKIRNLQEENEKAKKNMEKVALEVKMYVSGESRKLTFREQLNQKIDKQDKVRKQLMEEQKAVKDNQANRALQVQYWKDLEILMECKIKCIENSKNESIIIRREKGAETLILPQ